MDPTEVNRFSELYQRHLRLLKLQGKSQKTIRKLFVGGIGKEMLVEMLQKRLGSYAPVYQDAFPLIVDYSSGNARQALRLLNAYYFRRTQHKNDHTTAIALACHQVGKDLLNMPYGRFPTDIDFIKDISDESDPEGVRRLSAVLDYLKESGGKS